MVSPRAPKRGKLPVPVHAVWIPRATYYVPHPCTALILISRYAGDHWRPPMKRRTTAGERIRDDAIIPMEA